MSKKNKTKYVAYIGMLSAFAIILSYIEMLIPVNIAIPGIKLGLANFLVLICLYEYGLAEAVTINVIRIIIIGFMFGNAFSILFSLAGAFVSMVVMFLLKKIKIFGITGVSVAGGVSHNMAQIFVAAFIVGSINIVYYIPLLIAGGVITGVLIGILANIFIKRVIKGGIGNL